MLEGLIQQIVDYLKTPEGQSRFSYYVGKLVQSAEQKMRGKREEEERRKRREQGGGG